MSDDKKLNLPAIKKSGGLSKVTNKKKIQSLDLSKKTALAKAMKKTKTVQQDIYERNQGLDLVLVGDLTGSMNVYHDLLKDKFQELCNELFLMIKNLKIGIIFYLDHDSGDPYITQVCQLTKNMQELQNFIEITPTGHGGDEDEAVEDAFNDIVKLNWREIGNRSVVLFGDARPHEPDDCPSQYSYFDLTKQMFDNKIIVNSVFCGEQRYSTDQLQQLKDTDVGDFSERVSDLDHADFFSWVANVTGGMIIGVEQIDDLIDIIMAAAAKDSGNLEEFEERLKSHTPHKLKLINIAKKAQKRIPNKNRKLLS